MSNKRYRYTKEQEEWITDHIDMSVDKEYEAFKEKFQSLHTLSSFKTRRAKLNNQGRKHSYFTEEEDGWIIANYPHKGVEIGYPEFCERFGRHHSRYSFISRAQDLGCRVTADRWKEACKNNGRHDNDEIGTIRKRGRGQNWIKVGKGTDNWIPLSQYLLGDACNNNFKSKCIIHLDGDKSNDNLDNLRVVSRTVAARMTGWGMWSDNPIITETGILCCELQEAIDKDKRV